MQLRQAGHYVFRASYKFKLGHRLEYSLTSRKVTHVQEITSNLALRISVPDVSLFSTHSLRAGGALAAVMLVFPTDSFRDTDVRNLFPV